MTLLLTAQPRCAPHRLFHHRPPCNVLVRCGELLQFRADIEVVVVEPEATDAVGNVGFNRRDAGNLRQSASHGSGTAPSRHGWKLQRNQFSLHFRSCRWCRTRLLHRDVLRFHDMPAANRQKRQGGKHQYLAHERPLLVWISGCPIARFSSSKSQAPNAKQLTHPIEFVICYLELGACLVMPDWGWKVNGMSEVGPYFASIAFRRASSNSSPGVQRGISRALATRRPTWNSNRTSSTAPSRFQSSRYSSLG